MQLQVGPVGGMGWLLGIREQLYTRLFTVLKEPVFIMVEPPPLLLLPCDIVIPLPPLVPPL